MLLLIGHSVKRTCLLVRWVDVGPGVTVDQICSQAGSSPHVSPSQHLLRAELVLKALLSRWF